MAELRRPINGRVIAGVCSGIADRFGVSRTTVRVIAVLSCLLPGPQFLLYAILWIAIPPERSVIIATVE
jgi:phage shock protein PspC (stress-responsive transcriptional regulator)